MKILLILSLCLFLSSCGWVDRKMSSITGNAFETCMNGVLYYQFTSGAAVAYNKDGSLKLCDKT